MNMLSRVLHASGYLSPGQGGELSEDDLQAGRILHHFMRAAFYNTHETTQVLLREMLCSPKGDFFKVVVLAAT